MTDARPTLDMWVVYDHPRDYPDEFVARRWFATANEMIGTGELLRAPDLDTLRGIIVTIAPHITRIPRDEVDDPTIVEVWL